MIIILALDRFVPAASIQSAVLTDVLDQPHLGSIILSVLYVHFAIGSILALPIIKTIGSKYSLFIGGFSFVLFLAGWFIFLDKLIVNVISKVIASFFLLSLLGVR